MFRTKFVEEIRIDFLCWVTFFENSSVYEIMCKNVIERGRPQMTIWRMRIACWIPKATHTHTHTHTHTNTEYVILIAFPLQQCFARMRLSVTLIRILTVLFIFISVHNDSNRRPNVASVAHVHKSC
jgi:hypothetical protein